MIMDPQSAHPCDIEAWHHMSCRGASDPEEVTGMQEHQSTRRNNERTEAGRHRRMRRADRGSH